MSAVASLLALGLLGTPPGAVDLRFVDYQRVLEALPEAEAARARIAAARKRSQGRIDRRRAAIETARPRLSEAELAERARALDAEIDAAEAALRAMEAAHLGPLLERLDRHRAAAETDGLRVVRLDQVPLLGWPRRCDATEALLAAARAGQPLALSPRSGCRARALRVVDVPALAADSELARAKQAELDAFRTTRQDRIDRELERVRRRERAARTPAERSRAAEARAALDRRVAALRDTLEDRKRAFEDRILERVVGRVARAARSLDGVAVTEPPEGSVRLSLPRQDGFAWAKAQIAGARVGPEPEAR